MSFCSGSIHSGLQGPQWCVDAATEGPDHQVGGAATGVGLVPAPRTPPTIVSSVSLYEQFV